MENIITPPAIEVTTNPGLFKLLKGNRVVKPSHVRKLKAILLKDSTALRYTPILVNAKFEIIDGQHRHAAVEQINQEFTVQVPIFYIVKPDAKLKTAQAINSTAKPWTPNDYAQSYIDQGNENYVAYKKLKDTYRLNHDVLLQYIGLNQPITSEDFRDGILEAENMKETINLCDKLMAVGQYYPEFKKRSFAIAFKALWQNPDFDWSKVLPWFEKHGARMENQPRPDMYLSKLIKIIQ